MIGHGYFTFLVGGLSLPAVLVYPHPILDEILRQDPTGYALFH